MKRFFSIYLLTVLTVCFATLNSLSAQSTKEPLAIGDKVPAFSLRDQDGKIFNSADFAGKKILVIYFYPKDESMVCTKEACSFRDSFDEFTRAGAMVIGINGGTVASHKNFHDHYKLPFTLLSDPDNKIYHLFGVKNVMFMTGRKTFVVDLHGRIAFVYEAMLQGKQHVDDALNFIEKGK